MRRTNALLLALPAALAFVIYPRLAPNAHVTSVEIQRRRPAQRTQPARARARRDYSKFSHQSAAHRLACDSCHKIPTRNWTAARAEDPFPDVTDYPDHASCVRCHREQFFKGARPAICTVCHTNVSPRDGTRFVFRNPGDEAARGVRKSKTETQFATLFPHDRHQDVMASITDDAFTDGVAFVRASFQQPAPAKTRVDSCSSCHQTYEPQGDSDGDEMSGRPKNVDAALWPKKGTFKTTPTGHASCYNCHWQEGGVRPLSSDCAGCHTLLKPVSTAAAQGRSADADVAAASAIGDERIREKLLRREAARFLHEEEKHENIGCTGCHIQITSISTLDPQTLEVPLLTCGGTGTGCHIRAKPKGILNVELEKRRADASFACAKCHVNYGRESVPKSHSEAVPLPKP